MGETRACTDDGVGNALRRQSIGCRFSSTDWKEGNFPTLGVKLLTILDDEQGGFGNWEPHKVLGASSQPFSSLLAGGRLIQGCASTVRGTS